MPGLFQGHSWHRNSKAYDPPKVRGTWTQVQNKKAKERKEQIKEEEKRKKQQRRDLAKRNLTRGPVTWTQVQNGANKKALARAQNARDKKAAKKAEKKANHKGQLFYWE